MKIEDMLLSQMSVQRKHEKFLVALTVLTVITLLGVAAVIALVLYLEKYVSDKVVSIVTGDTLPNIASSLSEGITRGIRANLRNSNQ